MDEWRVLASPLAAGGDLEQLAACLFAMYEAGRSRFAALPPLEPRLFAAHLAHHLPAGVDRLRHLQSLVASDLYLACACVHGLPGAAEAFDGHYLSQVGRFVGHFDRSPQFADEVRQLLRERLLVRRPGAPPRLADFSGRGALMVWVRVSATRVALGLREREAPEQRAPPSLAESFSAEASPELQLLRRRHQATLAGALRTAVAALRSEERVILRMYFSAGQNTSHIAAALRVDRSTAARRLAAARKAVFAQTRRALQDELPLTTGEFRSLMRALHGDLEISLRTLLG